MSRSRSPQGGSAHTRIDRRANVLFSALRELTRRFAYLRVFEDGENVLARVMVLEVAASHVNARERLVA
jgi:hypothetical protein